MQHAEEQVPDPARVQVRPDPHAHRPGECDQPGKRHDIHQEQHLRIAPDERHQEQDGRDPQQRAIHVREVKEPSLVQDGEHDEEQPEPQGDIEPARHRLLQHAPANAQRDAGHEQERRDPAAHQLVTESAARAIPLRRWTKMLSGPGIAYAGQPCHVPTSRSPVALDGTAKCTARS